jgi:hypothetical protein
VYVASLPTPSQHGAMCTLRDGTAPMYFGGAHVVGGDTPASTSVYMSTFTKVYVLAHRSSTYRGERRNYLNFSVVELYCRKLQKFMKDSPCPVKKKRACIIRSRIPVTAQQCQCFNLHKLSFYSHRTEGIFHGLFAFY